MTEKEWLKIKVDRYIISQLNDISKTMNIEFEDLCNQVLKDGIDVNQPSFTLRNEFYKRAELRLKFTSIYGYLGLKCPTFDDFYVKSETLGHFYVDFASFLLKKNFTEYEILGVSMLQDAFNLAKQNYPDVFSDFKKSIGIQQRTQAYKLLFGSLGMPNQKTLHESVNRLDTISVTGMATSEKGHFSTNDVEKEESDEEILKRRR